MPPCWWYDAAARAAPTLRAPCLWLLRVMAVSIHPQAAYVTYLYVGFEHILANSPGTEEIVHMAKLFQPPCMMHLTTRSHIRPPYVRDEGHPAPVSEAGYLEYPFL